MASGSFVLEASIVAQVIINGVLLGGIFMMIAVGLSLIYGVMRIINYAHGELLMIGMYLSYFIFTMFGIDPYWSLPLTFLILFAIGAALQHFVINPAFKLPYESQVITFVGLIYVIQNLAVIIWSPNYRNVNVPWTNNAIDAFGTRVPYGSLFAVVFFVFVTFALHLFIKRTRLGRAIRATSQEPLGASLVGVDTARVRIFTFALGAGLVGAAAAFFLPMYYVYPYVGTYFGAIALIIITLGGLGSFPGTIIGSLIIGLTMSVVGFLISSELATAVAFVFFLLILMVRPGGIMGK